MDRVSLRDVDMDTLLRFKDTFDPVTYRRVKHVVTEIQRWQRNQTFKVWTFHISGPMLRRKLWRRTTLRVWENWWWKVTILSGKIWNFLYMLEERKLLFQRRFWSFLSRVGYSCWSCSQGMKMLKYCFFQFVLRLKVFTEVGWQEEGLEAAPSLFSSRNPYRKCWTQSLKITKEELPFTSAHPLWELDLWIYKYPIEREDLHFLISYHKCIVYSFITPTFFEDNFSKLHIYVNIYSINLRFKVIGIKISNSQGP